MELGPSTFPTDLAFWVMPVVLIHFYTAYTACRGAFKRVVMLLAKPLASFWFTTNPANGGLFVKCFMGENRNYPKIFNSIIGCYLVDVMHYFMVLQRATQMFRHHKAMLKNVTAFMSIRVPVFFNKDITVSNSPTLRIPFSPFAVTLPASYIRVWACALAWFSTERANIRF